MQRTAPGKALFRWLITSAFVVVLAAHTVSGRYRVQVVARTSPAVVARIAGGRVTLLRFTVPAAPTSPAWSMRRRPRLEWWVWWDADNFAFHRRATNTAIVVALWPALVGLGVPTAVLWRRHLRARRPDGCGCGYPLAGLEAIEGAVICPECGARHGPVDSPGA